MQGCHKHHQTRAFVVRRNTGFNPVNKLTIKSTRNDEARMMDVAMVEVAGLVLVLVYVLREPNLVRVISLRRASKQERTLYAQNTH